MNEWTKQVEALHTLEAKLSEIQKYAFVIKSQCDQMARLCVQYSWPFTAMKNCPMA